MCKTFAAEPPGTCGGQSVRLQLASTRERHQAWLKRTAVVAGVRDAWRPVKRHRASAAKWISQNDNQLRVCTAVGGLVCIRPEPSTNSWSEGAWRSWPFASVALDQGGDGLAGLYACQYKPELRLNLFGWFDLSHGACRDVETAFRAVGKWQFMLLMLVPLNLAQGPERDEGMRWQQLQEAFGYMMANQDPEEMDLYQDCADDLLKELKADYEMPGVKAPSVELWHALREVPPLVKKGYKTKLCEYMAWVRSLKEFLKRWHWLRLMCSYISLENDFFTGTNFRKHLAVPLSAQRAAEMTTSTDANVTQLDSKILRSACQNAVVATWAITSHAPYRRQLCIMVAAVSPLQAWQGEAAKVLRDIASNSAWLADQFRAGFVQHLVETLRTLSDQGVLSSAGFFEYQVMVGSNDLDGCIRGDDDFAKLFGGLVMAVVAARVRRLAYLWFGYPGRLFKLMLGDGEAAQATRAFQEDCVVQRACIGQLGITKPRRRSRWIWSDRMVWDPVSQHTC